MIISLLAALVLVPAPQGKTLFEQVCPNPTGRNGYEEYLRAADIVNNREARLFLEWRPGRSRELEALRTKTVEYYEGMPIRLGPDIDPIMPLARRLEGLSLLDVRREAVTRYGRALELVRQGNQKQVWDPRERVDWDSAFPEFIKFKFLAKLAVAEAYVWDADGQGMRATETLIQSMTLAEKTNASMTITIMFGVSHESTLMAAFQERLPRLSQAEARRVVSFVEERLAQPVPIKTALQHEASIDSEGMEETFRHPIPFARVREDPGRMLENRILALAPGEIPRMVQRVRSLMAAKMKPILARFDGPESGWGAPVPESAAPPSLEPLDDLAEAVSETALPYYENLGIAVSRSRAQLRLLRLAARVIAFRWEHERLPPTLGDAAPADEIGDPLTGGEFQYTPMGDQFRVFSRGTPQTGEIDLKYLRPTEGAAPPPGGTHGWCSGLER